MTDEPTKLAEPEEAPDVFVDGGDWLLRVLVNLANKKVEIGITLHVGGLLVSGMVAPGAAYLEAISKDLTDGFRRSLPGADFNLGDVIAPAKELYANADETSVFENVPGYIHIRNARIYGPGGGNPIPGNRGMWWRGRISEISGFSLGELRLD